MAKGHPILVHDFYDKDVPLYLCKWNDGDIIEVHTPLSLFDTYKHTNMYEAEFEQEYGMTLNEVLASLEVESFRSFDNMDIRRIK